jgi:hypothetical protein
MLIYLLIYALFSNVVNSSDHTVSNDRIIVNNELERMEKEESRPNFWYCPAGGQEGPRKPQKPSLRLVDFQAKD